MRQKYDLTRDEFILFLGILIYYTVSLLDLTVASSLLGGYGVVLKGMRFLSYLLFVVVIADCYITKYTFLFCTISMGILALSAIFSTDRSVVYILLMLIAATCSTSKRVIRFIMSIQIVFLMGVVFLSKVGVVQDIIFDAETRARHGLGFTWTSIPAILFFYISLEYIYVRSEKLKVMELVVIEAIHLILFRLTDSRMCFIIASGCVFAVLVYKMKFRFIRAIYCFFLWISPIFPVIICSFSLYIHIFYEENHGLWDKLNSLLSNRLQLGYDAVQQYGISMFGQYVEWIGNVKAAEGQTYNFVDSSYLQLLINFGALFLIFVICIYVLILVYAKRKNDVYMGIIVTVSLGLSITEPRLWNIVFNALPFLIVDVFLSRKTLESREMLFRRGIV